MAAFYETPFFECTSQSLWLERSGVPVPRTAHVLPRDPIALEGIVKRLGGFPVVAKVPGGEGGTGVIRADSPPALYSLLDYLPATAVLMEYFEHVVAHRLVVVGRRIVAAEARHPGAYDFRSNAAGGGLIGRIRPSARAARIALAAARALRLEFGGADVLEDARGRMVLAELNFPCYFASQQHDSGIDIAGAMVDHLLTKAGRAARGRARGA
jgi:ribosomal protein S6--L-glutamate ligase